MIGSILAAAAVIFLVQYGLPALLLKRLGLGVIRCGSGEKNQVALTFDDGPDPVTTPQVLAALRQDGTQATFFVSGTAAVAHPDLVKQIISEGHEVGSHGHRHRHAFLRGPIDAYLDTCCGVAAVQNITGERPRYFRPPHGAYTLTLFLACLASRVKPVHWTVEAHDWHPDYSPARVVKRVLGQAVPGSVLLLHDGGPGGVRTAMALPSVLAGLRYGGLKPVPLSTMVGLQEGP